MNVINDKTLSSRLIVCKFNGRNDNLGDQIIFNCLLDQLKNYGNICLYGPKPDYQDEHWMRMRSVIVRAIFARLKGCQIYLVDPPGARLAHSRIQANNLRAKAVNMLWAAMGARRVRVGISVAPEMPLDDMSHYHWIGVRDQLSLDALHAQGVTNAVYCPDLAFLLPARKQVQGGAVLLSFRARFPDNGYSDRFERLIVKAVPSLIENLRSLGLSCEFYYQVDEDRVFNQKLAVSSGANFRSYPPGLYSLKEYFDGCEIVISNRLHVLLAAASCGALPIGLTGSDHVKLKSLFETMCCEKYIFNIEENIINNDSEFFSLVKNRRNGRNDFLDNYEKLGAEVVQHIRRMLGA